mmetsp:Transcript_81764/g.226484  ORF Transcript_81764/g.226484 Transcript_81764/m.226484 type:complete len:792 (+) Transcript_81764:154-2529(+)
MADCLAQLRALLVQLDSAAGLDEVSRLCKELLKIGRRWPEEAMEEEAKAFERLSLQLMKFADSQQQDIVAAFRPLREDVRQRMADTAAALNGWLSEALHPEKASPQRLAELLQAIDDAPQMRWYKKCTDLGVKVQFLVAIAAITRAVAGPSSPLRSRASGHPQTLALVQRLSDRFFEIPEHGNVLDTWHDGRLEYYNATLWRAAKRAADRLKDDLQVRLVSALRRATAPVQPVLTGGKSKPQLQLELHQWPMVSCPLARTFLDFVAQRGPELGDLGQPCLSECPPHSLLPATLRKLLGRLDAFEVLDDEGAVTNGSQGVEKLGRERLGVVRLRWEAVAALAFKAVGTKPKAASLAGAPSSGSAKLTDSSVGAGAADGDAELRGSSGAPAGVRRRMPPAMLAGGFQSAVVGAGVATHAPARLVQRRIDWSNARALQRLVRRGLLAGDEEWRQAWHQFCKQRRVPADLVGLTQGGPPREVLAEFTERHLQMLLKRDWAKDLMYKMDQADDRHEEIAPAPESDREDASGAGAALSALQPRASMPGVDSGPGISGMVGAAKGKPKNVATTVDAAPAAAIAASNPAAAAAAAKRRGSHSREEEEESSSASESSRSKRRKRRKREKRKMGMMGYGDYFGRSQGDIHISPEVMMMNMNQMMGMSMMMNGPLAMMGMGAPMMPHQMPMMATAAGLKMKKDEKAKRDKLDEKPKKDIGRDPRKDKAEPPALSAGGAGGPGSGAGKTPLPPPAPPAGTAVRDPASKTEWGRRREAMPAGRNASAKADWSRQEESMIDADDL